MEVESESKGSWKCLSCKKTNNSDKSYCLYCYSNKATIRETSPKEESKRKCADYYTQIRPDSNFCYNSATSKNSILTF